MNEPRTGVVMTYKNIVVAVDNDVATRHVCSRALDLYKSRDAQITLVHVLQPVALIVAPGGMGGALPIPSLSEEEQQEMIESAKSEIAKIAAELDQKAAEPASKSVHYRVVQSSETRVAIHEVAKQISADLIVAGSHGRHGFSLFFLGSTASDILKDSPCDVLAVRLEG
jgi:universal stress protein A